jgi:hypothetical protein
LDENELLIKIAEIRSYIASDWPGVEERKRLYESIRVLENTIREKRDVAEKIEPQKSEEA